MTPPRVSRGLRPSFTSQLIDRKAQAINCKTIPSTLSEFWFVASALTPAEKFRAVDSLSRLGDKQFVRTLKQGSGDQHRPNASRKIGWRSAVV